MERTREELNKILAEASGQSLEKITEDTDRDFYMNAQEAIEYGLADAIVENV
jgi:ATP-dependent Clp protease, protease subunit